MTADQPSPLKLVISPPPPNPNRTLRKGFSIGQQTGVRKRIYMEVGWQLKAIGWDWAFAPFAIGPAFGIWAMWRLRREPDALKLAGGRK